MGLYARPGAPRAALFLGMNVRYADMTQISRRDFLNGMALTIATGLTPVDQILADPLVIRLR